MTIKCSFWIFCCPVLYLLLITWGTTNSEHTYYRGGKVCRGTKLGLSNKENIHDRYEFYQNRYTNCTYIDGNLEITFLSDVNTDYDLSFLSSIKEVSGYILIVSVYAKYVPLSNIVLIRGTDTFEYQNKSYALFVSLNSVPNSKRHGIFEIHMQNLTEIQNGSVFFHNNFLLCHENHIKWSDILPPGAKSQFVMNATSPRRQCNDCHHSCIEPKSGMRHCWGDGPDFCQKLSRDVCDPSCSGRCFGPSAKQCCNVQCAGGCYGPNSTNCYACKVVYDEGDCVGSCPKFKTYDKKTLQLHDNPNAKYEYGNICVKNCPEYLLKLKEPNVCVRSCPKGTYAQHSTCIECAGACPKTCKGVSDSELFLTGKNIQRFENCTLIEGNLVILRPSFLYDIHTNTPGITNSDLQVLRTVREITGFLKIQLPINSTVRDLSFLSNLETILGRTKDRGKNAISILGSVSLESLQLKRLKTVKSGDVMIGGNIRLCYLHKDMFQNLFRNPGQLFKAQFNGKEERCRNASRVCDPQCKQIGCWGEGNDMCLQCKNFKLETKDGDLCLENCNDLPLVYNAGNNTCKPCHEQCAEDCFGPGSNQCSKCKNVAVNLTDQTVCMESCPNEYPRYMFNNSGQCTPCNESCDEGCTGAGGHLGEGGCNSCLYGISYNRHNDDEIYCLPTSTIRCPDNFYESSISIRAEHPLKGKSICRMCHELCETCTAAGEGNCVTCRVFSFGGKCSTQCPGMTFPENGTNLCKYCHKECREGCSGYSSSDCHHCINYKIYTDFENNKFNCSNECPPDLHHLILDERASESDEDSGMTVCAGEDHPVVKARLQNAEEEEKKKIALIVVPVIVLLIIIGVFVVMFMRYWKQRATAKENTAKLTAKMTGYDETEPLTPTDAMPDLAKLRLIKESDLRRGGIIGSGAFGTVYKGFWIPNDDGNQPVKIPVAIKVLQEGTSPNQNKELLEEARVMASVDHMYCVRILAVCMTAQMMLITQLMPLGCLLDYVRKHKDNIGSKVLLNWCTQIAKGMNYLEERGIVHRDLAARNVLVHSSNQVRITDFGLAKLLDYDEEEYHSAGGKMPIKWLALECIQHRIFTHKSDVWSYGVTIWELFTYGQRPYENVRAKDVPDLLEKGERLPQPSICTIDVYMIMIKCWMLDADSRPSFKELGEEFAKMARDPGRYLVIPGDKLMRLPSHSYNKDDLVRSLSVPVDGPEEVMEAEDYLQPQSTRPNFMDDDSSAKVPLLPANFSPKEDVQLRRDKRYAHLDSAAAAKQQRENDPNRGRFNSVNSRYSSDPIKFFKDRDEIDAPVFNAPVPQNYNNMSNPPPLKPSAPQVDEDNYLKPTSSIPVAYMDVMDGKEYYVQDKPTEQNTNFQRQPPPKEQLFVQNPEYFEKSDDCNFEKNGFYPKSVKNPDYYNELNKLDRFNQQTQPLMDMQNPESHV